MSIRVVQVPDTDLLLEFVEHHDMVNLCRRGSTEVFTMAMDEYRELCIQMPRLRARACACSGVQGFERMIKEPIRAPRRIGPNGEEL